MGGLMKSFNRIAIVAGLVAFVGISASANAATFLLQAEAIANNGVGSPQSALISSPGSASTSSSFSAGGVTAVQTISGSLTASGGSISYLDGWTALGVNSGAASFNGTSVYSFTLTNPGTLNISWTSTLAAPLGNPSGFGLDDINISIDSSPIAGATWGFPAPSSGSGSLLLAAGSHVLTFSDPSNIGGNLGTQIAYLQSNVSFSVSPVPLPGGLPLLGACLAGFGAFSWRRGRRKSA